MPRTQRAAHAQKQPRKTHPRLKKALHLLGLTVAVLLLVTLFYLAVILGQPEEAENPVTIQQDQPLLTASPALNIQSENQVTTLAETFPCRCWPLCRAWGRCWCPAPATIRLLRAASPA